MSGVYHCSPTNSTFFTTCCDTAILDHQERCPACGRRVYPFSDGETNTYSTGEVRRARWEQAFGPFRKSARKY